MLVLEKTLNRISLGNPQTHRNLTMVPLLDRKPERREYLTLPEAFEAGTLKVGELPEAARVPTLEVRNEGDRPVLLVDGELLQGARQDRALNLTVLVPAHATIEVPVSCVEQGRWGGGANFVRSTDFLYAAARAQKMADVSDSLAAFHAARSDQVSVWEMIHQTSGRLGVRSPSGTLQDVYRQRAADLRAYRERLHLVPGQAGAAFVHDGRVLGVELLDHPDTFGLLFGRYVRSYALDVLDDGREGETDAAVPRVTALLRDAVEAHWESHPAIGLGSDLRLRAPNVEGAGLAEWGKVVQVSLMGRRG
jgi:hypothetical protein